MRIAVTSSKRLVVIVTTFVIIASIAPSGGAQFAKPDGPADVTVRTPVVVSGNTPLPRFGEPGACGSDADHQDWENEPAMAINPKNPDNIVSAWIQDFADAIVVGYSTDGGKHWNKSVPATTACTGGDPNYNSAIDPSLAFGPDGVLYLASNPSGAGSAIFIHRSLDGGRTWSRPIVVDSTDPSSNFHVDATYLVADQSVPGRAYALWRKADLATTSSHYMSVTTDRGQTWSAPALIPTGEFEGGSQLLILPGGALLYVFEKAQQQVVATTLSKVIGPTVLMSTRWTEQTGWSAPSTIALMDVLHYVGDGAALAPDGKTVYVAWQTSRYPACAIGDPTCTSVMYAKSSDGGNTWQTDGIQATGVIASFAGPPEMTPNIVAALGVAVAADGSVGVMYYDHRNDGPATDPPRTTDLWLSYSRDGGNTWSETLMAGPFDQTTAPTGASLQPVYPAGIPGRVAGGSLGDYESLIAVPGGFGAAFALAKPVGSTPNADGFFTPNPTDIYFAKVNIKH
jgi:hypothetical protein